MTRVASPPRRPSILAIRSRWPVHVPTRDTESSAPNTGVETRMANAAEYKRAFMWGLHAWVLRSCTADVGKVLPAYPLAEGARLRKKSASSRWCSPRADRPCIAGASRSQRLDHPHWAAGSTSQAADRLRLLGQLRAVYHARRLRPVHVAPLHAVWRQDRADRIAIVVHHQNRVVTRDRGDELLAAARRGKRAGENAAVLLVDGRRERDAVEPRLGRGRRGMMRIARPEDDRLALAFPGAAKVGDRALLRRRGRGRQRCEHGDPGKVRHG